MAFLTGALAVAGLASSLYGTYSANRKQKKEAKKQEELLRQEKAANEAWYMRNYHREYLNSAEAQNAIRRVKDAWGERLKEARGRQTMSGGTIDQIKPVYEVGGEAVAETIGDLAAKSEANKAEIDRNKLEADKAYMRRDGDIAAAREQAAATQKANAIDAGISAMKMGVSSLPQKDGQSQVAVESSKPVKAQATSETWYDWLTGADKWDAIKSGQQVNY